MIDYRRVVEVVREETLAEYVPNACIAAARITTLALRRLGIKADAIACELEAFSPSYLKMVEHFEALGRRPTSEDIGEWYERGAWKVSLVFAEHVEGALDHRARGGYHGHVVVLAEERTLLLDATLAQVERPQKGLIVPPPYVFPIPPDQDELMFIHPETRVALHYRLLPDRRDFMRAPDWRAPGRRMAHQDRIIQRVIDRLEVAHADHR